MERRLIDHPHPFPVLCYVAFERYRMWSCAVGAGRPNARLFAFVPLRERVRKAKAKDIRLLLLLD